MAKVLCVLYPDPVTGYPPAYARDTIPVIASYPGGESVPTPVSPLGFRPGSLLGSVSGELGLRPYLEANGHELIVTSDKDGADSTFDHHLPDADIVISQPFWPAYLTADRIDKAKKLKLALTAGIGSDHVDLKAAAAHGISVAEETYSNSISVAEHVVMMVLSLVRNYLPAHQYAVNGGWNIADCVDYIRVPMLVVQGADDQYGTVAQVREIEARSYAPVDVEIFDGCWHSPHIERPERLLDSVKEFCARLDRIERAEVEMQ